MVSLANPISAADAIPYRRRFTASLIGPHGSGKTTALAEIIGRAEDSGIDMGRIAAFAPTMPAARHLSATVMARWWPDALHDVIFDVGKTGTPLHAIVHNTVAGEGRRFARSSKGAAERAAVQYLEVLRRLNGLDHSEASERFLRKQLPKIRRAILYDLDRRLRDPEKPYNSYLYHVAVFYEAFKNAVGEFDIADMVHSACYVDHDVRLLVLDEVNDNERRALVALYPDASIVAATFAEQPELELILEGVEE